MGKRTSRKSRNLNKTRQRLYKKTNKKQSRRKISNRKHKYTGGDDSDFKSVMLSILNDTYIPFLPTTISINDKDQRNNYIKCVSAFDLLTIIGKNPKFSDSKTITSIVKEIDTDDNKEIFNLLGDLTKVPLSRKVLSKFMINCARLKQHQDLKQLRIILN